jgi:hypothetical protein
VSALDALRAGWQVALGFNPLASVLGAGAAAALLARDPGPARRAVATIVLVGAWFVSDAAYAAELFRQLRAVAGSAPLLAWGIAAAAALGGFALGYALPAWAGVFVGRRVTWGTGWASAAVTAATVSVALATITGALG